MVVNYILKKILSVSNKLWVREKNGKLCLILTPRDPKYFPLLWHNVYLDLFLKKVKFLWFISTSPYELWELLVICVLLIYVIVSFEVSFNQNKSLHREKPKVLKLLLCSWLTDGLHYPSNWFITHCIEIKDIKSEMLMKQRLSLTPLYKPLVSRV